MGSPATWSSGWAEAFAAMLMVSFMGKFLGNETRILMMALIGAVITDSWVGIAIAVVIALITKAVDIVRGMS